MTFVEGYRCVVAAEQGWSQNVKNLKAASASVPEAAQLVAAMPIGFRDPADMARGERKVELCEECETAVTASRRGQRPARRTQRQRPDGPRAEGRGKRGQGG